VRLDLGSLGEEKRATDERHRRGCEEEEAEGAEAAEGGEVCDH
jgi:hypothetical protein